MHAARHVAASVGPRCRSRHRGLRSETAALRRHLRLCRLLPLRLGLRPRLAAPVASCDELPVRFALAAPVVASCDELVLPRAARPAARRGDDLRRGGRDPSVREEVGRGQPLPLPQEGLAAEQQRLERPRPVVDVLAGRHQGEASDRLHGELLAAGGPEERDCAAALLGEHLL